MVSEEGGFWLSVSLGPVQRFIQAARSVRDLKTGSTLLSALALEGIRTAREAGGRALYPLLGDGEDAEGAPNQFTMIFSDRESADQAAEACAQAIQARWKSLANDIKNQLQRKWTGQWDASWDDQIDRFWSIRYAIVGPDDIEAYDRWFSNGSSCNAFQKQWRLAGTALDLQKQVRHFPGNHGIGRNKCSMMGELEQMGPGGRLGAQDLFWTQTAVDTRLAGIRLHEHDRLCAVALVKRFAAAMSSAPPSIKRLKEKVPDTAQIALQAWLAECETQCGEELSEWNEAVKAFTEAVGEDADLPGRYLLDDDLRAGDLVSEQIDGSIKDTVEEGARRLVNAREALLEAAKSQLGAPPRYYAIVKLDGDKIGDKLQALNGLDPLQQLSKKLSQYAEGTRDIVVDHHGEMVYAGGDDVLALMPAYKAISCALRLREAFPGDLTDENDATASVGILVCHYKHDLRDALEQAEHTLQQAKDHGRDAIGLRIVKKGGGPLECILSHDLAQDVGKAVEQFAGAVSDRWLYHLDRALHGVSEPQSNLGYSSDPKQLGYLMRHFLRRMQESPEADIEASKAMDDITCRILETYQALLHESAGFFGQRGRKPDADFIPNLALTFSINALMSASFLARGRD